MISTRAKNLRRYRRDSLAAGRFEMLLAIGVVVALLAGLALVALPSPLSRVVAVGVVLGGVLAALVDNRHEEHTVS